MKHTGVCAKGLSCPIIREGDDLAAIVVDSVLSAVKTASNQYEICNKAVVGITESIVARAQGNYASVDDIAEDVRKKFGADATIYIVNPIYSRNRFAIILRGIARAAKNIVLIMPDEDEVGNVVKGHPFTNVNYDEYYAEICEQEGANVSIFKDLKPVGKISEELNIIIGNLHGYDEIKKMYDGCNVYTLADLLSDRCEFGVLGSNKSDEERIKLFPNKQKATQLALDIQKRLKEATGKEIYVAVYGDGCFKDPVGGIWEFADPVSMPAYTNPEVFESTPNELKVKALADDKFRHLNGEELLTAINEEIARKDNNLKGSMQSQGTTPRLYRDLLASLMDLISGSGDRCTPIVLIQNYFK